MAHHVFRLVLACFDVLSRYPFTMPCLQTRSDCTRSGLYPLLQSRKKTKMVEFPRTGMICPWRNPYHVFSVGLHPYFAVAGSIPPSSKPRRTRHVCMRCRRRVFQSYANFGWSNFLFRSLLQYIINMLVKMSWIFASSIPMFHGYSANRGEVATPSPSSAGLIPVYSPDVTIGKFLGLAESRTI